MGLETRAEKKEAGSEVAQAPEQSGAAKTKEYFMKVIDNPDQAVDDNLAEKGIQKPGPEASAEERRAYTAEKSRMSMDLMTGVIDRISGLSPAEQDEFVTSMRAIAKFDPVINESTLTLLGLIPDSDLYEKFIARPEGQKA